MRRTALTAVILVAVLCLFASGTERDAVKVYFTVGSDDLLDTQLWRCNRDGSAPELLYEGYRLGNLAVDSEAQIVYFTEDAGLMVVGLDGSNPTGWGSACFPLGPGIDTCLFDAKGGYFCMSGGFGTITSLRADHSDPEVFYVNQIPGIIGADVVDVALHIEEGSPVQSTSWGRVKSLFR